MSDSFHPIVVRERRRRFRRLLLLIAVLLVLLVGSALLWPRPQPGPLAVATTSTEPQNAGVLTGRLDARRVGNRVCFTAVSAGGERKPLIFGPGWSAARDSALIDAGAVVRAEPGERVLLFGEPGRVGTVPGCDVRGRIWSITDVQLAPTA